MRIKRDGELTGTVMINQDDQFVFVEGTTNKKWGGGDEYLVKVRYKQPPALDLEYTLAVGFVL